MTKKNTTPSNQNTRNADVNLGSRYGAIGISAVAAALHFKSQIESSQVENSQVENSQVKNPAQVPPLAQQNEERLAEFAA
jgi:hypothetical protein